MDALSGYAPAKVNLTLRVGLRRDDGYHEVESLVVHIGLCDRVRVVLRRDGRLELRCDAPGIPTDETNLALRAARRLRERCTARPGGATIELSKRIPTGAGLGGGSSDAATTLMLLDRLWNLRLPQHVLAEIAAGIGADVPLFLNGPAAVIRGRGEYVAPVTLPSAGWIVLLLPSIHCQTAAVYAALEPSDRCASPADVADVLEALREPERAMDVLFNDLEAPAMRLQPALRELARRAGELAGGPVRMSGSGAALYRLFGARYLAETFARRVRRCLGVRVEVTRFPWGSRID